MGRKLREGERMIYPDGCKSLTTRYSLLCRFSGHSQLFERGGKRARERRRAWMPIVVLDLALRVAPDRLRKVRIVHVARDHVPVQVGHDVAEAREVDLVGPQLLAQYRLDREHHIHEVSALAFGEIRHL